jgi:hypothetical protein
MPVFPCSVEKVNKLLSNILGTSLPKTTQKQPKTKLPKWDEKLNSPYFFPNFRPLLLLLPSSLPLLPLAHLPMHPPLPTTPLPSTPMLPPLTTMSTPLLMTTLESTLVKAKAVTDMPPLEATTLPFPMAESKL